MPRHVGRVDACCGQEGRTAQEPRAPVLLTVAVAGLDGAAAAGLQHLRPEHLRTVTAALPATPCAPAPEKGRKKADPGVGSGSGAAQDGESAAAELAPYLRLFAIPAG